VSFGKLAMKFFDQSMLLRLKFLINFFFRSQCELKMANLWKKAAENIPAIENAPSSGSELKSALKKVDVKV
jgi:hypothetical protein